MVHIKYKKLILILTDCLKDLEGGAERQIFELAKGLDKTVYHVTIASLECEGTAPRSIIESAGCKLVIFPVKRIYGLSGILQGFSFFKFLKQNKLDVLMTYHFSSDIWGTFLGRLAGVRMIISNRRDMGFWRSWQHILAYKLVNASVHKIVVNANAVKELICEKENISEKKIHLIRNGINIKDYLDRDQKKIHLADLKLNEDDLVVMHVANIRPVKGHEYLIKAMAMVIKEIPNIKLVLIGEDELEGKLSQQAQELNIADQVIFLGKRKDVRSLIQIADICVLPSLSEGMSNAIMEYMVAGKPVIATDVGGNPELVEHEFNGLLILKENVDALRDALLKLAINHNERKQMGENGFKKAEIMFSMDKMIQAYKNLFVNNE